MGNAGGRLARQPFPIFFIDPASITPERISFSTVQQHQLRRVLRLRDGERILVCDGTGREVVAALTSMRTFPSAVPLEIRAGIREPSCKISLYQSALRGDRFTWLLQKGTEIGISRFTPVLFVRTQPSDYASRIDRFQTVVREAAEQCERSALPRVDAPLALDDALGEGTGIRLLLDERETATSLRHAVPGAVEAASIFVGPEGGLTDGERSQAVAAGAVPVTLGTRILRSETAGLVAATILLSLSNDLG